MKVGCILKEWEVRLMNRTFIESNNFPISTINEASIKEKSGGGRPPYWEMVFWWTRKPLAGARAVIAGTLLPEELNPSNFIHWLRLSADKTPHKLNPILPSNLKEQFKQIRLLDPFAGFGSIPLEAIRLGIGEVVAVEFLPTIYIFLKAVLEYPKKYGVQLKLDVERWGRWIAKKLREDPDIKELYDEDVAVYIGTWEVKCPICNRYTPLVGNWWLAKVKGKKYVYMKSKAKGDNIDIEIIEGKTEKVPSPNVRGRPELAECLLCGSRITYIDPKTGRIYRSKSETPNKLIKERLEFYPKHTINDWNRKLEEYLEGRMSLEELRNTKARPRLLVKVKIVGKDLKFEPCNEEDNEKLWKALEKLKQIWGDLDIPTEPIPSYESRSIWVYPYGFDKWFKLFNPRQLLTLVKLVKLIREVGKNVEKEKLNEGWSREEAFKYAEAITTYLVMEMLHTLEYNSIVTYWDPTFWGELKVKSSFAFRGIAMNWNWCEYFIVEGFTRFSKYVINGLSYLVSAVSGNQSKVRVLLDDATVLSKLGHEKFDIVVTDPPYRDDVPYTELSDFYYVWLKRALSNDGLTPKFHVDALIYNTQWESFALNEISYNKSRLDYFGIREAEDYYEKLMGMAFSKMAELLKDNGLIVTYFAHSSPEAWIELIEAGWRRANLRVSKAWNFATESAQRVTARGKTALESSIVVVWRKRKKDSEQVGDYREVYREALENAKRAKETALRSGLVFSDLFLATMIGALATFTSYDKVLKFGKELTSRDIIRESYAIATRVIANATETIKSPEALFYLASKALYRAYTKPEGQLTLEGISVEPIVLSSQDVIILSYGFLKEKAEEKKEGVKMFEKADIIRSIEKIKGAKVAQQKMFILLEPLNSSLKGIKEVLGKRHVNPIRMEASGRPLNSIDVLHLLEYYAKQGRGEFDMAYQALYNKRSNLVREAIEMARVIERFSNDPESSLARLCLDYVGGR